MTRIIQKRGACVWTAHIEAWWGSASSPSSLAQASGVAHLGA